MALSSECEVHGWSWDPADDIGCPVCHGIAEERERIIKLLEENDHYSIDWLIELIKGENK